MITFIVKSTNDFNPNEYLTGVFNVKDGELIEVCKKLIGNEVLEGEEAFIAFPTDGRFIPRAICYIEKSDTYLKALRTHQINKIIDYANSVFGNTDYSEFEKEVAASRDEK